MDSLEITAGPTELPSKDELDLVIEKFTKELLAYFSELDCPNSSNEPLTMQEWKMDSRLLAQKLQQLDNLPSKQAKVPLYLKVTENHHPNLKVAQLWNGHRWEFFTP
ncbi:hypothetical protein ACH5RR_015585 [Cinchona calisaya]|uniref:Uncharacterized protein n=1 Tax=Cinchona calisaya TaxID=153742 RepID=A0ABD2ZTJ1_9GENT